MNKPIKLLLALTAALSVAAIGWAGDGGPDDYFGSPACQHAQQKSQCQKHAGGESNPQGCTSGKGHPCSCGGGFHGKIEGARPTLANTDNGITITITADDPAVVKLIQARFAEPPKGHSKPENGKGSCCPEGPKAKCDPEKCKGSCCPEEPKAKCNPEKCKETCKPGDCKGAKACGTGHPCPCAGGCHGKIEGAQRTVTNTDSGVIIAITSDDPAVVKLIQTRFAKHGVGHGQTRGSEACRKAHEEGHCKKDAGPGAGG